MRRPDVTSLEAGKVSYVPGYALASVDSVDITVRGVGGHGSRNEVRTQIIASIERISCGVAMTAGVPEDRRPIVKFGEPEGATYNNPELSERVAGAIRGAIGKENVSKGEPVMGSED